MADVTPEEIRGRAFGFHRAADTAGAVVGPLIGLALLAALNERFRLVFVIAGIPALAGVALLSVLRERKPREEQPHAEAARIRELGAGFYLFLGVSLIFALGNSSDAFLILRSKDLGLSTTETVTAYVLYNTTYSLLSLPAGAASDRLGRRNVIGAGFLIFAFVYLGFAAADIGSYVWPLFAVYGVYMALTDGVGRALVTDFVPARDRATAIGLYTGATGGMILISSVLAGVLWDTIDASAPFYLGAATASAALVALVTLLPRR